MRLAAFLILGGLVTANPNLPASKVIHGAKTFVDQITFQLPPVMPQNQQSVNVASAAGSLSRLTGSFAQPGTVWNLATYPFSSYSPTCIIFDPKHGGVFVAASQNCEISRSTNNGQTWA